jgi:hypothetical protein
MMRSIAQSYEDWMNERGEQEPGGHEYAPCTVNLTQSMRQALLALQSSQKVIALMADNPHIAAWGEQLDENEAAIESLRAALGVNK